MKPELSIVIVSLNVRDILQRNLEQLFALPDTVTREVIVVDNASEDGTTKMIRERFPQVELIQNDVNRGFGAACNQGIAIAKGDTLLMLNPDMWVHKDALDHTHSLLQSQKDIGILGIRLVGEEDSEIVRSVRRTPTFKDQLAILLKLPHLFPRVTDHYLAMDMDYGRSQDVEQVRGSFFAFRRDILETVGAFDERFFVWFEEVDLCNRVREAGYRIHYSALARATDLVGQLFKQQPALLKQHRFTRSMSQYFFKWHGWLQGSILWVLRPYAWLTGLLTDLFKLGKRT